jgi:hypothetical protein
MAVVWRADAHDTTGLVILFLDVPVVFAIVTTIILVNLRRKLKSNWPLVCLISGPYSIGLHWVALLFSAGEFSPRDGEIFLSVLIAGYLAFGTAAFFSVRKKVQKFP